MNVLETLHALGFAPIFVLNDTGLAPSLIIAAMRYEAEAEPAGAEAWIHPYYPVSQRAYHAAARLCRETPGLTLRPDIRVKPLFARLPGLRQGRNTLSYLPDCGSRFHVQVLTSDEPLPPTGRLLGEDQPLQCASCRRCMEACPTGAIQPDGFHRQLCLRNWQLNGQSVPGALRGLMGNRLLGCDECQRCCPHNPAPAGPAAPPYPLRDLLTRPKAAAQALSLQIGANLALPNRLLTQACIIAGCARRTDLTGELHALQTHPSKVVAEAAEWGENQVIGNRE